jgi:uncharacterized membrane protein YjjP (DUF1212 family)
MDIFLTSNRNEMELVMPSLVFLLVGVAVAFFLIPSIAPTLLITGSVVVLGAALYLHYSRFGVMEYERSTWQYNLKQYSSWVIVGAVLLGAYGFYAMNQGAASSMLPAAMATSVESNFSSPAMPALAPPMMGGGMGVVWKTASSRLNELMRRGRISID